MSEQLKLDQFYKSGKSCPAKRYEPVKTDELVGDAAAAKAESEKQNENKEIRPFVYILPCHIIPVWQKVSKNLLLIQNRECNLQRVVNLMKENFNSHLTKPRNVNLDNLIDFFDEMSHSRIEYVQNKLLPFMARLALELPTVFDNHPVLIMQQGEYEEQQFSKHQIASLLANLFFLTTHEQPCTNPEFSLPFECSFFFFRSNNQSNAQLNELRKQKIAFLLAYFEAIEMKKVNLDLRVSFERLCPRKKVTGKQILENKGNMIYANIYDEHRIESGQQQFQVSFANNRVGGGVLKNGSLQEEIRYLISPECLISVLIFDKLGEEEAILIQGTQQISNYSGYSRTLKFEGLHNSSYLEVQEENLMLKTVIIGIDALNFNTNINEEKKEQFSIISVLREIRKAESGFNGSFNVVPFKKNEEHPGVITGNWGCGDFGGDKQLKFIIQWLAASMTEHKSLTYCTNDDIMQKIELEEIVSLLIPYQIKEVFSFLREFIQFRKTTPDSDLPLFVYLLSFVNPKN